MISQIFALQLFVHTIPLCTGIIHLPTCLLNGFKCIIMINDGKKGDENHCEKLKQLKQYKTAVDLCTTQGKSS